LAARTLSGQVTPNPETPPKWPSSSRTHATTATTPSPWTRRSNSADSPARSSGADSKTKTSSPALTPTPTTAPPRKKRDKPDDIKDAVLNANIFQDSNAAKQFAANICGFRNGENKNGVKKYAGTVGASRQPILSKVRASITETKQDDEGNATEDIWTIEVQVISPWDGDCIDDTDGLSTNGISLKAKGASADFNPSFPNSMAGPGDPFHTSCTVSVDPGQHFTKKVKSITLECKGKVIDEIDGNDLGDIEDGQGKHRPIYYKDEERYPGDSHPVRVVYIGDWTKTGFDGAMQEWKTGDFEDTSKIPIRFPRSVLKDGDDDEGPEGGLPPYWKRGISEGYGFRAFARLGDLNQVLCPRPEDYAHLKEGEDGFWPWVPRVAKASPAVEKDLKFSWRFSWRDDSPLNTYGDTNRMNAANVFCVGGPWNDQLDNDGDGYTDYDGGPSDNKSKGKDQGVYASKSGGGPIGGRGRGGPGGPGGGGAQEGGRFGGPELRVAGKINVNTATRDTLKALETALGVSGLENAVHTWREQHPDEPLRSPAQILQLSQTVSTTGQGSPKGDPQTGVEATEMAYTLLSNILTVRSDTFSIYGTVQYGHVTTTKERTYYKLDEVRSRRFWALVDRSPSLAFCPHDNDKPNKKFIHPRVLNFQWLD